MVIKKILLVGNAGSDTSKLIAILAGNGYAVEMATDGQDALSKTIALQPDLILMEVALPGINGFEATRLITKDARTRHVPVIMLDPTEHKTSEKWALIQGAAAVLAKPVVASKLFETIATLPQPGERPAPPAKEKAHINVEVTAAPVGRTLSEDAIIAVEQCLVRYVGPMANILVRKSALQASGVSQLCATVADYIADVAEKNRFSQECAEIISKHKN